MKALPLWQPWASLVACGAKTVETRHWPAPGWLIGQRIAIHATKTKAHLRVAELEPFDRRLRQARDAGRLVLVDGDLPLGAIVATAVLKRCGEITEEGAARLFERRPDEHAFGNYDLSNGPRFAWVLHDVERLERPVPWKGSQGIFDVPGELLGYPPPQGAMAV